MKAKVLSFRCLINCGVAFMHAIAISICLLLTFINIFAFQFGVFPKLNKYFRVIPFVIYYFGVLNYFGAYIFCIFSDPGRPPKESTRYYASRCHKCQLLRPERTHHCGMCGKCCMKFDHHCPWVANCVGLYNYGYFIKYLLYGFSTTMFGNIFIVFGVSSGNFASITNFASLDLLLKIMALIFGVAASIASGLMLLTHLPYVKFNQTTLEYDSNRLDKIEAKHLGLPYSYPYDRGVTANLIEIFGPHVKKALLIPFYKHRIECDGFHYSKASYKV